MIDEDTADIISTLLVDAEPATEAPKEVEAQAADEPELEDVTTEDEIVDEEDQPEDTEDPEDEDDGSMEVDTYTFKRDGEEVTLTVPQLIEEASISGTARKRLEEATAMRASAVEEGRSEGMQQAQADIATRTAQVDSAREQLSQLFGLVGNEIFSSRVERPDQSMQETDPIGYVTSMENWRDDQARINGVQQQIAKMTQEQNRQVEQRKAEVKRDQQHQLSVKRPELATPDNAKAFTADVRLAQTHFGFNSDEVDAFPDHRGLLVLEFVGKILAKQNAQGLTPAQKVVRKTKVKTMTPGSVVHNRAAGKKNTRVNRDKARSTGRSEDVAKTLIVDAPR